MDRWSSDPSPPDRLGRTWLSNVRLPPDGHPGLLGPAGGAGRGRAMRAGRGAAGAGRPWDPEQRWRVAIDGDGRIATLHPLPRGSRGAGDDWGGDWLSPAGVDLQINGGLGLAFPELTPADLPRLEQLLELLWRDGVEAICPTLVTCGVEPLRQALAVLREARQAHRHGRCRLLGAHLEGPFLAASRRGAHPLEHLAAPSLDALEERIAGFLGPAEVGPWAEPASGAGPAAAAAPAQDAWDGPEATAVRDGVAAAAPPPDGPAGAAAADIALVTLAPELEGAAAVIDALNRRGVLVSLGHSQADEAQAAASFKAGVRLLTHTFNAMAGLGHRAPGPIAAALARRDVGLGLIADGVHVAPSMAVLLQRLAPDRVLLVSDALAPYGLAEGRHRWDDRTLLVENGSCRLEDGTLAGVTLPLLEGARRLSRWSGRPDWAIAAATVLPRRALGEWRPLANLLIGRSLADCLRWRHGDGGLLWRRAG
jgi:N-acetylglucosamine-6-phosphate deacetylase